ncbi:MAG: hypothetical protein V3T38_06365 [Gammaproteobacteria bacterium]
MQEKNGVEGIVGAETHQGGVYHPRYRVEDSRTECLPDRRKACLSLGLYPRASTMGHRAPQSKATLEPCVRLR